MEGEVDEAIWIAQVHLHPIELSVHIYCHTMCQHFQLGIDRLNDTVITIIIQYFFEQIWEALTQDAANSDRT